MQISEEDSEQIQQLTDIIVECLSPYGVRQVYLFGSFAYGTPKPDSDFDFYVVVRDGNERLVELTVEAYHAMHGIKRRAVDIMVGTKSMFDRRKRFASIESEVHRNGVLLYDAQES